MRLQSQLNPVQQMGDFGRRIKPLLSPIAGQKTEVSISPASCPVLRHATRFASSLSCECQITHYQVSSASNPLVSGLIHTSLLKHSHQFTFTSVGLHQVLAIA